MRISRDPTLAVVGPGSNLGDREATLRGAVLRLGRLAATRLVRVSSLCETAPVGPVPQGPFLNGAALLETRLEPRRLLDALLEIERAFGRVREVRWGPRTLDLDLLLFGDAVLDEPGLSVPHPELLVRAFALSPLLEVWPDAIDPRTGRLLSAADEAGASSR